MGEEIVSAFGYDWKIERVRSGRWVGVCDSLGIATEGMSRSELFECAQEAVRLIQIDKLCQFAQPQDAKHE
jgi:hypothetical protein